MIFTNLQCMNETSLLCKSVFYKIIGPTDKYVVISLITMKRNTFLTH